MTLVFWRLTSPQNSKGNIGSRGTEWQRGMKNMQFSAISGRISETVQNRTKLLTTNSKWHMCFRLVPKIIDLGWPWTAASSNFLGILRNFSFARQQQLNEWRQTSIFSDGIVAHWKYFSTMYRLCWYCWAILSGGRFSELRPICQGCCALTFALAGLSC